MSLSSHQVLPILILFCGASIVAHPSGAAAAGGESAAAEAHFERYLSSLPTECTPDAVRETAVQCEACRKGGISDVDPELYANLVNHHFNPIVSAYYHARQGIAFLQPCPVTANLPITSPWTARFGANSWDELDSAMILRDCTFPTVTEPFICIGSAGTPGTRGQSFGTLTYTPLLTNSARRGEGIWTLFCQCWDASTSTRVGTDSPVSWNVFSTRPTMSAEDEKLISAKLSSIGFNLTNMVHNVYEPLFPEP